MSNTANANTAASPGPGPNPGPSSSQVPANAADKPGTGTGTGTGTAPGTAPATGPGPASATATATGWVAGFGRAGVVVTCLTGILGGAGTLLALVNTLFVGPNVRLTFLGSNIDARLETTDRNERRMSFDCWFAAKNSGRTSDTVYAARAYVVTGSGARLPLPSIRMRERGEGLPRPSFIVDKDKSLDVLVSVGSVLDEQTERAFRSVGLHTLVVEFQAAESQLERPTRTYCFWMGEQAAEDLARHGTLAAELDDSRCTGDR